ncbi:MAG: poly(3-hydroxybutyrate) depolymerase [Myxococcota bacterium]|jgi:poly(3-hydroxybutyrate) depolymerase
MLRVLLLALSASAAPMYGPNGGQVELPMPGAGSDPRSDQEFRLGPDGACGAWGAGSGPVTAEIPFGNTTYTVDLYGKPGQSGRRRTVVLLHGATGDKRKVVRQTGFDDVIARDGGLLVVPDGLEVDGIGKMWDNGSLKSGEVRNDADFLDAVVRWAEANACAGNVMAVGFSNGAQMAMRWACGSAAPDIVMTHAGTIKVPTCNGRNRWLLAYAGSKDPWHLEREMSRAVPSEIEAAHLWHGGSTRPATDPATVEVEGKRTCSTWTGNNPVQLCVIEGWGHKWPSPITNSSLPFDATEHAWRFFKNHLP